MQNNNYSIDNNSNNSKNTINDKETILVCCAHADDETIGMGGTIAKYSKEGIDIITVIFSFGENSSPWLKSDDLILDRKKEAKAIGEFLGSKETIFLGLKDAYLEEEIKDPKIKEVLKKVFMRFKPSRIFTHASSDPHKDHRSVNELVAKTIEEYDKENKIRLYTFEVWNVVNDSHPVIYVDVTKTFRKKIEAMKKFKSQKVFIYTLLIPVYIRAILSGRANHCRFAEKFYKVR